MNKNDFMKAMTMIDDDLLNEAEAPAGIEPNEHEVSVSGVEKYNRPIFKRIAVLAASLLLVIGVGAVGVTHLSHRKKLTPENDNLIIPSSEITSAETSTDEVPQSSETSALTEKNELPAITTTKESSDTAVTTENITVEADIPEPTEGITEEAEIPEITTTVPAVTESSAVVTTTAIATTVTVTVTEPSAPTERPTKPVTEQDEFMGFDFYESLSELSYMPYTCDCLPEYELHAPDGTTYYFNLSSEYWVRHRTPELSPLNDMYQAGLTKTQVAYLNKYGEELGLIRLNYFNQE